jgi:hypothetical protein
MKPIAIIVVGLSLASVAACSKSGGESQPAPSATALTDEALDVAPIPVKEDFEEQAAQAINEDNLDEQLSKLEKEIESDK